MLRQSSRDARVRIRDATSVTARVPLRNCARAPSPTASRACDLAAQSPSTSLPMPPMWSRIEPSPTRLPPVCGAAA